MTQIGIRRKKWPTTGRMIYRLFEIYQMSYNTYFTTLQLIKAGHINMWPTYLNSSLSPLYFSKNEERIITSEDPGVIPNINLKIEFFPINYLYKYTSRHIKTRLPTKFAAVKIHIHQNLATPTALRPSSFAAFYNPPL